MIVICKKRAAMHMRRSFFVFPPQFNIIYEITYKKFSYLCTAF